MDIQQPKKYKVLLIGDSCIDVYHYGSVSRISPEAPVPVVKITRTIEKDGMVANVRNNLLALGLDVTFKTNTEVIRKVRYIDEASNYHLLRVDEEPLIEKYNHQHRGEYHAVVISDYNKGFVCYELVETIRKIFKGPIFIDTKKTDLKRMEGCIVKINRTEELLLKSECSDLIVTLGSSGAKHKGIIYPTKKVDVFDVCGAGDTFLSSLCYKYILTDDISESIEFANIASSITVRNNGVYSPSLQEINDCIDGY